MHRFQTTTLGCALACAVSLAPAVARAHFILMSPASSMSQDSLGNPQKVGPCGGDSGGTATGEVTAFRPGETVTIRINEVIPHPGHYRVALAVRDRSELPEDPEVKAGTTPCGSAKIQRPAIFPVLGDGLLEHTTKFDGPQTMQVRLPTDVTCTKCSLQVLEFMSEHDPSCFYYHCADISIQGDPVDGGTPPKPDGGGTSDGGASEPVTDGSSSGGCAMSPDESPAALGFAGAFVFALALRRRRRGAKV